MSIENVDPLFSTSISLFSALRHDDLLPRDIGFEIVPGLPTISDEPLTTCDRFRQLYYPSAGRSLWQNLAFSLAISQDVKVGDTGGSLLAIGARTLLIAGRPSTLLSGLVQDHEEASAAVESPLAARPQTDQAEQELATTFIRRERLRQRISEVAKNRVGFMLEAGGALVLAVPKLRLGNSEIV